MIGSTALSILMRRSPAAVVTPDPVMRSSDELFVTPPITGAGGATDKAIEHFRNKDSGPVESGPVEISRNRFQIEIKGPRGNGAWYQVVGDLNAGDVYEDVKRKYLASPLPVLREMPSSERSAGVQPDVLLPKLYDTVVSSWRMLTDVRFKLLGLVPAVSVIAWAQLLREEGLRYGVGRFAGVVVGLAGLAVTVGIWTYDRRNDQLYNDLISRARRIELEMGVDTGVFRGRPEPKRRLISHSSATAWVYLSVFAGWILLTLWFLALGLEWIDPDSIGPPATLTDVGRAST